MPDSTNDLYKLRPPSPAITEVTCFGSFKNAQKRAWEGSKGEMKHAVRGPFEQTGIDEIRKENSAKRRYRPREP